MNDHSENEDHRNDDYLQMARPGSALSKLMHERGNYVPSGLVKDFEEALRYIAIQRGMSVGNASETKIVLQGRSCGYANSIMIVAARDGVMPPDQIVALGPELEKYTEGRDNVYTNDMRQLLEVCGDSYRDIFEAILEGHIRPNLPDTQINVKESMDAGFKAFNARASHVEQRNGNSGGRGA